MLTSEVFDLKPTSVSRSRKDPKLAKFFLGGLGDLVSHCLFTRTVRSRSRPERLSLDSRSSWSVARFEPEPNPPAPQHPQPPEVLPFGPTSWNGTRRRLLSLAAAPGLLSCGRARRPSRSLRVAVSPRVTMASTYLAKERGFFDAEGLDVSFVEVPGSREAVPLLAGGQVDVAMFSFTPALANAISRGSRIRIVAAREEIRPGCSELGALYYRRQRFPNGLRPQDLKRVRVALASDSSTNEFFLYTLLRSAGVSYSDVRVSTMKIEEAVAAASAGYVDMFFGSGRPNFMDRGLPADLVRSDILDRALGEFQYSYVVYSATLLDGGMEPGASFLRAYLRGARAFVAGDSPRFLDDLARRLHLKAELVRAACRQNVSLTGEVRTADLDRWLAWAADKRYLTHPITSAQLVDLRFHPAAPGKG